MRPLSGHGAHPSGVSKVDKAEGWEDRRQQPKAGDGVGEQGVACSKETSCLKMASSQLRIPASIVPICHHVLDPVLRITMHDEHMRKDVV